MIDVFTKEKAAGCLFTDHIPERTIHSHVLKNIDEAFTFTGGKKKWFNKSGFTFPSAEMNIHKKNGNLLIYKEK